MRSTELDILVVGAGIHGAALARAAAAAGFKTALIDKGDFGEGASANSLKILHGGLRYLQSADLPRMRESIRSRRSGLRQLPYFTRPAAFLVPTGSSFTRSKLAYAAAAFLNNLISFDRNRGVPPGQHIPPARVLSQAALEAQAPGLEGRFKGALWWHDGLIEHTERYTLAYVFAAREAGAAIANYCKAERLLTDGDRVTGVAVRDLETGESYELKARITVDATSGWRNSWHPAPRSALPAPAWVRAMNIVVRKKIFHETGVGLDDGIRNFFFVPWRGRTMIGTACVPFEGRPDESRVTRDDLSAFVDMINQIHPSARLSVDDITYVHAGILPAKRDAQGNPTREPEEKTRILSGPSTGFRSGYWIMQGVKYTTAEYRADKMLSSLARELGRSIAPSSYPLYSAESMENAGTLSARADATGWKAAPEAIDWLLGNFGARARDVIALAASNPALQALIPGTHAPRAAIVHAVRNEEARHLVDFVLRRTDLGTAERPAAESLVCMADWMAEACGWSPVQREHELARLDEHYARMGLG